MGNSLSVTTLSRSVSPARERRGHKTRRSTRRSYLLSAVATARFNPSRQPSSRARLFVVKPPANLAARPDEPVKVFTRPTPARWSTGLGIIGKKIIAAQLLYGDDISAAFASDEGGSLLEELAKEAASNSKIPDLRDLFAASSQEWIEPDLVAAFPLAAVAPLAADPLPETELRFPVPRAGGLVAGASPPGLDLFAA